MEIKQRIVSLSLSQQIALYAILKMENASNPDFSFLTSDFSSRFKSYAQKYLSTASDDYGKYIGGILSGMTRNGMLDKLSGDRDKLWTLPDEVKVHIEEYKKSLQEIKQYWKST